MDQKCNQCQKMFNGDSIVAFGDDWVCHICKPIYVQRLKEGVEVTEPTVNSPLQSSRSISLILNVIYFTFVMVVLGFLLRHCIKHNWFNPEVQLPALISLIMIVPLYIWSSVNVVIGLLRKKRGIEYTPRICWWINCFEVLVLSLGVIAFLIYA